MPDKQASPLPPTDGSTLASRPSSRSRARTGDSPPPARAPAEHEQVSDSRPARGTSTARVGEESDGSSELARALLEDELTRSHGFSAFSTLLSCGVLFALPMLDGTRAIKLAFCAAMIVVGGTSLWVWRTTRPGKPYARSVLRTYTWTLAVAMIVAEQYIGVFSPIVVLLALGIYYMGQSADRVQSTAVPAFVSGAYIAQMALMTFAIIPDRGLFSAEHASFSTHVFGVLVGAGVFGLTVYLARVARASMRVTIMRSNEAMLLAQRREALLVEAQQHLERALDIALGKPGQYTGQLAGEHRLGVIIGFGAMGEIYAATHVQTGQRAAVKLLHLNVQERADLVERFLREGDICLALRSPYLVQVFAVGTLEGGAPYLAMEMLEGSDLATLLRKEQSLSIQEVTRLAHDMAEGLSHAHASGVIHRDLKPVNLFRSEVEGAAPCWKILDFGISKMRDSTGTLTQVSIVGTPAYMSPEQACGHPIDQRSDIFSMAVVLYRALTGRPAFTGNDTPQVMFEVVYKTPERPSSIIKGLPTEIDLVLAIALAKDPQDRWQSSREFAQAFELASRQSLGTELRARAHAIVKTYPWGQAAPQVAQALARK